MERYWTLRASFDHLLFSILTESGCLQGPPTSYFASNGHSIPNRILQIRSFALSHVTDVTGLPIKASRAREQTYQGKHHMRHELSHPRSSV